MKALTLILAALLASLAVSTFIPIPDYDVSHLEGTWNVQSVYDTTGNDFSRTYCFEMTFQILNDSAINMTSSGYDSGNNQYTQDSYILYPNSENGAILYQDTDHTNSPIIVVNSSSLPYWVNNGSNTLILAINYTVSMDMPQYILLGLSQWYDTQYDIRPFITEQNLPQVNYTQNFRNFYFINTACDAHFGWVPQKLFDVSALEGEWNLLAVYEPFGEDAVAWYTEGPLYPWEEAICAKVSFEKDWLGSAQNMTLSLQSLLYRTNFERTWDLGVAPNLNAALMGFDINGPTLLYVGYADLVGNLILTAGTTTSFFLSSKASTLTTPLKAIFDTYLTGYRWNINYVIPIAPCDAVW